MKKILLKYRSNQIRLYVFLLFYLIQDLCFSQVYAQTLSVTGTVTTSTTAVQNASVTFIDNSDTTRKYFDLTDAAGNYQIDGLVTSIKSQDKIPTKFELEQNYPNPFSSSTIIPYALKQHTDVYVTIYDLLGRVVRKMDAGVQPIGSHKMLWDGCNNFGHRVAAGIYFYRIDAGGESKVRKMLYTVGGNGLISLPQTNTIQLSKASQSAKVTSQGSEFTVLIENTSSSYPQIISKQIDNVVILGDTTINFTVSSIPEAIVYLDSVHQYIRGFGGANILQWRPDMTSDQVRKAFGTGPSQIGFSILRLRVPYDLTEWSMSIQLPTAKIVQSLGGIVFASPWTMPASMKTNNNIIGGDLKENSYADYAAHLKSFADYMSDHGAPLYAISIQNEPDIAVTYESCDWSPSQMVKFISENAPSIGTRIIAPESFQFRRPISDAILNDSAACANLDIVGGHIYGGGLGPYPLAVSKGKELWMTEHLELDTSWTAVLATGNEINNCMLAGMNAYVWWYIVRFYGPISEDGEVTKRGYFMSQFARFVRPGYYRVECRPTPQRHIFVTAFKDSSSSKVILVVLNTNSSSSIQQTFTIPDGNITALTPYTTSRTKNCEQAGDVTVTNGSVTVTVEASSITTFVSH